MSYGLNNGFPFPANQFGASSTVVPQMPPQVHQQPQMAMMLVNNEQEAINWNVLPGNSLFFMDSNNKLFYTKSVDFSGMVIFKKFRFEEVGEKEEEPSPEYVTREEFEKRLSSINKGSGKPFAQHQKKGDIDHG